MGLNKQEWDAVMSWFADWTMMEAENAAHNEKWRPLREEYEAAREAMDFKTMRRLKDQVDRMHYEGHALMNQVFGRQDVFYVMHRIGDSIKEAPELPPTVLPWMAKSDSA